jgi:hypothetical protein
VDRAAASEPYFHTLGVVNRWLMHRALVDAEVDDKKRPVALTLAGTLKNRSLSAPA